jgi:hypothetical protein
MDIHTYIHTYIHTQALLQVPNEKKHSKNYTYRHAYTQKKKQILLEVPDEREGGGKYERVQLLDKRPALSELRELLATELQLDGLDNNEDGKKKLLGVDLNKLRSGVVVKTWWEQDVDKTVSDDWRN